MFDKRINYITASNYSITPKLNYYVNKIRVEFSGSCLKQDKTTFSHGRIVNIYIIYEISKNYSISSYPTLENCLFGAVSLTNVHIDKYKHLDINFFGYSSRFDRKGEFSVSNGVGRNVVIFGIDTRSSTKTGNRKKDILILGKGPTQEFDHTMSAEKI